jgi:beta-galactosidase
MAVWHKFNLLDTLMQKSLIITASPYDVDTTVKKLEAALQEKGIGLFALVDHSTGAKKAGLTLNDEKLLIFGDPKIGTYLMQENPEIGIELPLKILVWKDQNGKTQIAYQDPLILQDQYGIVKNAEILKKMQGGLARLVQAAIASP